MGKRRYFHWGLTAFLTVCALIVFYDTVFRNGVLLSLAHTLVKALKPVIYGAAMAYLLAPAVNSFHAGICSLTKGKLGRGLSLACAILIAWALVFVILGGLFSILIPQLYQSVLTLVGNMQTYYNTVYTWVMQLLDRNPQYAAVLSTYLNQYWGELSKWFTGTFLPQAQQTIGFLTSGVLSVLVFLKDFLVGVVVSVYLLALKEDIKTKGKRLLLCWTSRAVPADPADPNARPELLDCRICNYTLRALGKADVIFSGFVRGKLLDSLIIGVLCFIGSSIMGLPYTPLVSVTVGLTNMIPFFGPFLGAIPSAFLILLVSPVKCLYFIIFVIVLQQLDGNIIGPKILGGSTELPSFWVIVAILVGGGFFSVLGMFLGVPVFACVYAAVKHFTGQRIEKLSGKGLWPQAAAGEEQSEQQGENK